MIRNGLLKISHSKTFYVKYGKTCVSMNYLTGSNMRDRDLLLIKKIVKENLTVGDAVVEFGCPFTFNSEIDL